MVFGETYAPVAGNKYGTPEFLTNSLSSIFFMDPGFPQPNGQSPESTFQVVKAG